MVAVGTKITDIENIFEDMRISDPRRAAELAYIVAMTAKANGDNDKAIKFGKMSVKIFDELNVQTMEECAARYTVVNGIALPDLIHSDVVRDRLSPLKL